MTKERRSGDLLIMDKLAAMHTDLALNTQATKQTTEQLVKLNGKVVAQESRIQAVESNQALVSNNLATINQSNANRADELQGWRDWAVKGIIAIVVMLFYYLLTHAAGFPNFLSK
jgi:hypothetical protein